MRPVAVAFKKPPEAFRQRILPGLCGGKAGFQIGHRVLVDLPSKNGALRPSPN